nr:double-CXXCG motif protein [Myxococcus sp. MH1]
MSRYFLLGEDRAATAKHGGEVDATHRWRLPGVKCPACGATWSDVGHDHPSVDLSGLAEHRAFERPRPEPLAELNRLRELVRPLLPPQAELPPGTHFGPLVGQAFGAFGPLVWVGGIRLLLRSEVLEQLRAAGVRGLVGCRTELRHRQKNPPELLELQLRPTGRLHPSSLPADTPPACATCGRQSFRWPDAPILEAATLPTEADLFRLGDFATMVICTERFRDAVSQLALEGLTFRALPTR